MDYKYMSQPGHWATNGAPGGPPGHIACPDKNLDDTDFDKGTQKQIDDAGKAYGCHSCGAKTPGKDKDGKPIKHWTADHQPPRSTYEGTKPQPGSVRLYPQCSRCSRAQGGLSKGKQDDHDKVKREGIKRNRKNQKDHPRLAP